MIDYKRVSRKIIIVLFFSQSLSSAGFIAAFAVNALVGVELSGQKAMAGAPGAVYVLGQALGSLVWGFSMDRIGRRGGLALGQVIGVFGSMMAIWAVSCRSFPLFLSGLILVGVARSAVDLSRFAAAEVYLPSERGKAISYVVFGSTVGAVIGPLLVGPTGSLALWANFPELAGPYTVSFVGLILASILIFSGLRPDPRDIGRQLSLMYPETVPSKTDRSLFQIICRPGVIVAMVSVVFAQMVMVIPMSITSVHMKAHDHPLSALSLVISAHTIGMFAFSIFSGRLTDKWGRPQVIVLGSVLLIISCLMAAPSTGIIALISSLFILGLGWNFAYVAGSALLADQLSPGERAKTQGFNDLLLNMASASGQFASGIVYASHGYGVMANAAAAAAFAPLIFSLWWMAYRKAETKDQQCIKLKQQQEANTHKSGLKAKEL